jgi:hypothetical protein
MSKSEKEYNAVSLTLGIIGTVIGVLALLGAWIPQLGLAAIPFSIIGIALSGIGIGYALIKNYKAIELPVLGLLICIAAISLSIGSTVLAKLAADRESRLEAEQAQQQANDEAAAEHQRKQQYRDQQISELKAEIPVLEIQYSEAEKATEIAQSNYQDQYADYEAFTNDKPYLTNEVYLRITREIANPYPIKAYWQTRELQGELQQIAQTAENFHIKKVNDAQSIYQNDQNQLDSLKSQLTSAKSSLESFQKNE